MTIYALYDWTGKVMETLSKAEAEAWKAEKPYLRTGYADHYYKTIQK